MGFFSRHRKAFRSVIASFGMLFGLLAGCASNPIDNTPTASITKETSKAAKQLNNIGFSFLTATSSEEGVFTNNSDPKTISGQFGQYLSDTRQLIFKNNSVRSGELSLTVLEYTKNKKGSATVFGTTPVKGQSYKTTIPGKGEAIVELKVDWVALGDSKVSISLRVDSFNISSDYSITFIPPESNLGTLTVDGTRISNETTQTQERLSYKLAINVKDKVNYYFDGWQVDGNNFSLEEAITFSPTRNGHVIKPIILPIQNAVFSVGGTTFDDLNQAIEKARRGTDKTILLKKYGTVASGNYSLDVGLSLLIPNDETAQLSEYATKDPKYVQNTASRCYLFRKIIFLSGANLTVKGQVVVCCTPAFKTVGGTYSNHTAIPSGAYGQIEMRQGSSMVIESGAKLFAWGFVTGDGIVEAKTGATVYELFQMASWRGGSAALEMNGNSQKVFLINQYYVQNIECALKLWSGATEQTLTGTYMSKWGMEDTPRPTFVFIGQGGMFNLTSGYLIKKYNPSTDRMSFEIFGNGLLSSIAFKLTILKVNVDLDSKSYVLPINNNLTITIKQGFSCSTNQDLDLLPGSELIVEQGGSFEVQTGHYLTVYDLDNWGNYATETKLRPVAYSPTRTKTRTEADLADAKIALDGTLTIDSKSYLMTTGKNTDADIGARIISPGRTGVIKLTDAGATSYPDVYQYNNGTYVAIDHSCAKLQNGDHSYVQSAPGNTYTYDKVLDRWNLSANPPVKTGLFKTLDGNTIQTVLLHDDVKQSNYTGLFYYSKDTSAAYNAADERYYYLNKGVVSKRNEWWKDTTNGAYYHFGPNQYAYQSVSVVLSPTASGDNPARGIKARYFFDTDAKLLRMVSVDSITSNFSSGMTITSGICYYNGIKAGFGLFENQSHVYLAKDDGTLMANGTYYVPSHKINNIKDSSGKVLTAGLYYFDENGHMYDSNFKEITRGTAS